MSRERVSQEVLNQIRTYEAAATPGPWISNGHELYYGPPAPGTPHQSIASEADARLIAVLRSWARDLIADLLEIQDYRAALRALVLSWPETQQRTLTVEDARALKVCRICRQPPRVPTVLNFGEEFACEECLKKEVEA